MLLIQALRAWIDRADDGGNGWLRAIRNPRLGRAIARVHRDPALDWSVETLAEVAGMSRSGFSAQFREMTGEAPMQYVTRWRMSVAASWLREESTPLAELAERLGYRSEAAFSRAFKRIIGISPGQARRRAAI